MPNRNDKPEQTDKWIAEGWGHSRQRGNGWQEGDRTNRFAIFMPLLLDEVRMIIFAPNISSYMCVNAKLEIKSMIHECMKHLLLRKSFSIR